MRNWKRRRYLDNKDQFDAVRGPELDEKRKEWKAEKEAMMRRIRGGSFMNLGETGKKGFYDNARQGPRLGAVPG